MKVKLFDNGIMPQRAHFDDAGVDLFCPDRVVVRAHDSAVIDLKVGVQIPIGWYGKLESKSGLNVVHDIHCKGGVIDSGFRGSIKVRMQNDSPVPHVFERGDKVVQIVLMQVGLFDLEQADELDEAVSGRGDSGFGSTGR